MTLLEWLAGWPVWQQPAPPLWAALLAVLGVAWLLLPRGYPARWAGLFLLLPALLLPPPSPAGGEAWVDVLDVGQGLAVLVRTAEHSLLYDTGPMYSAEANAGQRVVVPFLRAVGITRLDALVVSHRDKDHSGGVSAVQAHGPIARTLSSLPELGRGAVCRRAGVGMGRCPLRHPASGCWRLQWQGKEVEQPELCSARREWQREHSADGRHRKRPTNALCWADPGTSWVATYWWFRIMAVAVHRLRSSLPRWRHERPSFRPAIATVSATRDPMSSSAMPPPATGAPTVKGRYE